LSHNEAQNHISSCPFEFDFWPVDLTSTSCCPLALNYLNSNEPTFRKYSTVKYIFTFTHSLSFLV